MTSVEQLQRWSTWLLLAALTFTLVGCRGNSHGGGVTLQVQWRSGEGFAGIVTFHEPLPGQEAGDTRAYGQGEPPEAGAEIADGWLEGEFGVMRPFVTVVRNPTGEPLRFWVAPHLPSPHSASAGLIIRCLCTGEQYEVPANGSWTRVLALGLNPSANTRGPVVVTHVFVAGEAPSPAAGETSGAR